MSVQQTLQKIQTALTAITNLDVYHYFAPSAKAVPYAVWYEEGEASSLTVGNHKGEQALEGYVDYYTKTEFDAMVDSIQTALNGIENCSWTYESIIYGDPTSEDNNTIHHTWTWRIRVVKEAVTS